MRLSILPSNGFFLEVILLQPNSTTNDLLDSIEAIAQILQTILNLLGVPTPPVLPPAIPSQAQQDFFFLQ